MYGVIKNSEENIFRSLSIFPTDFTNFTDFLYLPSSFEESVRDQNTWYSILSEIKSLRLKKVSHYNLLRLWVFQQLIISILSTLHFCEQTDLQLPP